MGPSWGLRKPWKPLAALGFQSDSGALLSLLPLTSPHSLFSPSRPLSLPRPPWALGDFLGLRKPWEPSEAFGSLGSSVRLRGLAPLTPLTPSFLPLTPLASLGLPGPLGPSWGLSKPWEPLQAFGSLGSSVRLRGLASLAPPHFTHSLSSPEPPWVSLGSWNLPGASGSLGSLQKPLTALGLQ